MLPRARSPYRELARGESAFIRIRPGYRRLKSAWACLCQGVPLASICL